MERNRSNIKAIWIGCVLLLGASHLGAQNGTSFGRQDLGKVPPPPEYDNLDYWAAHPRKADAADLTPGQLPAGQYEARVDAFFVHPTIYTGEQQPQNPWNADVNDRDLNVEVSRTTIKYQASVFNAAARVYAPHYRQAHYQVFTRQDSLIKATALNIAYKDVKAAFQYYLDHFNEGRPMIIASHSQGSLHAARLLKDFFEGKPLREKLVAAYVVGMPLQKDLFQTISPCSEAEETGCWISWNTYARDYYPDHFRKTYSGALSTNPLNWTIDTTYASFRENLGGVLRNFRKVRPRLTDAQNRAGVLWINKPRFFGNFLLKMKRYHIVDYNLFYVNIRENVKRRVARFLDRNP